MVGGSLSSPFADFPTPKKEHFTRHAVHHATLPNGGRECEEGEMDTHTDTDTDIDAEVVLDIAVGIVVDIAREIDKDIEIDIGSVCDCGIDK